jgi:PAS domain S-box-containing protein
MNCPRGVEKNGWRAHAGYVPVVVLAMVTMVAYTLVSQRISTIFEAQRRETLYMAQVRNECSTIRTLVDALDDAAGNLADAPDSESQRARVRSNIEAIESRLPALVNHAAAPEQESSPELLPLVDSMVRRIRELERVASDGGSAHERDRAHTSVNGGITAVSNAIAARAMARGNATAQDAQRLHVWQWMGGLAMISLIMVLGLLGWMNSARLARRTREAQASRVSAEQALMETAALRATLDKHALVSVSDARGVIVSTNDLFCAVSGYAREELVGKTHRMLNSGVHPIEFWGEMWRTVISGGVWHAEVCNRRKDGGLCWLDTTVAPFRGADGTIEKFVAVRTDITARKSAEERSGAAEEFLRSAIDSLAAHMVVLSADGGIISVNRAWRDFALSNGAADLDVVEGANYLRVCDAAGRVCPEAKQMGAAIRAVLAGEAEPPPVEYACHAPDEQRWFLCSVRGFTRDGERFAVVAHLNITPAKLAEAKLAAANLDLNRSREVAESASRAKSEFLANMSHEMRTPLTAILGYTDLLRDDPDIAASPDKRGHAVETIKCAGEHLLTVINDILDLSKIEADRMTVETVDTPLVRVLYEVESLMRSRAVSKGVTLKAALASPVPATIRSDPTRLRQILMNLVSNAVKFTEQGDVGVTASMVGEPGDERLVVDVDDTGPGIGPDQAARLFTAFGQGDSTVSRRYGGTGLGLVICRRLANMMGGDVKLLRTEVGKGTCFRLVLPVETVPGVELAFGLDAIPRGGLAGIGASGGEVEGLRGRVLLAEDGFDNQRLIAFHLRKAGAEVEVADNGKQALMMLEMAAAAGRPFDLLVTDMQMPEMDGYALARALREQGSTIPIIALTAHAMSEDRERCVEAGCDDYATKPIDKAALLRVCRAWIGRRSGVSVG